MSFEDRLQKAIERGQRTSASQKEAELAQQMTEEQLKRLHSQYRLQLSEHIEQCLKKLPRHFPGFQFDTVVSDRGWGAAVNRDDVDLTNQNRRSLFSRLEMVVRPFSSAQVLELTARGTIRNKEIFNRSHYQLLLDAAPDSFMELTDLWVLEYAEMYAARQ